MNASPLNLPSEVPMLRAIVLHGDRIWPLSSGLSLTCGILLFCAFLRAAEPNGPLFYVPENPQYTIVNSATDSIRFTLEKTLRIDERGHLVSRSSFVDPE